MLTRIIIQIEEGAYNIGAWALFVGKARNYPKPVAEFYAVYFAGIFMMGSILLLQEHLRGGHSDNA